MSIIVQNFEFSIVTLSELEIFAKTLRTSFEGYKNEEMLPEETSCLETNFQLLYPEVAGKVYKKFF